MRLLLNIDKNKKMNNNIEETKKRRILLVEDHEMNQFVAKKHIENTGNAEVTIADNGKVAIDKLMEKDFDLILMDIQMPIMNGWDTTKYIRTEMNYSPEDLPILAMTTDPYVNEKYPDYEMQDYIPKPVRDWPTAIAKIDACIQKNKCTK